ncbi:MAG: transposase [SAR324 cluster bacterium]|nr:transposase [SAR324 cluster bacterium]
MRVDFDRLAKVEFHGANVTSEAGLQTKLIKIGTKVVRHARYTWFQMPEASLPGNLFATILTRIRRLTQRVPV